MKKKAVDVGNANIVKRDGYTETLEEIAAGGFCPFCKEHLFKHHRRPILYESKYWLVTNNSWPYDGSQLHLLFIAQRHVEKIEDLSVAEWSDIKNLYKKIVREYEIKGATFFIRSDDVEITGATVNHLHAHLIVGCQRTADAKPIKALVGFKK